MMRRNNEELQELAYTALHQIIFGGGNLVLNRILQMGLIEKLVRCLDRKFLKTKELTMLFLVDIVEVGTKPCIERMISSQPVEKLANIEKIGGNFRGAVVRFIKGLDMCKNLSTAERLVMKQQVVITIKGQKVLSYRNSA